MIAMLTTTRDIKLYIVVIQFCDVLYYLESENLKKSNRT